MPPLLKVCPGLRYGTPSPRPLTISRQAIANKIYGCAFLMLVLIFKDTMLPKNATAHISGRVPSPKAAINKLLFKTEPVARAVAIAIYTNPQGSKPFNTPIKKNRPVIFSLKLLRQSFSKFRKELLEPAMAISKKQRMWPQQVKNDCRSG